MLRLLLTRTPPPLTIEQRAYAGGVTPLGPVTGGEEQGFG